MRAHTRFNQPLSSNDGIALKPTRVLLVDDHALVRAGIRALIDTLDGVEVVAEAGNGREALQQVEKFAPDLVLLDLTMPEMSGFEVLEQIVRRSPQARVIILTMHEAREYTIRALRLGAAGLIPKSAAANELKQGIEGVMRGETYTSKETPQEVRPRIFGESRAQRLLEKLTPRQREILILIAEGQTTKEIARNLNISVKTVETHRAQLMERLDIRDVAGLVRFAIKTGLVSMN
ncbi:MAG TPA: response regulator transcription factor [Pyrinomonadaceae bacterium]|nr:response regulator transcription factor [Pyrinomonadaceae bacterium]